MKSLHQPLLCSVQRWLEKELRIAILEGRLRSGSRLPSTLHYATAGFVVQSAASDIDESEVPLHSPHQ
jgi:hypothetical protein